jgi:UDP-GlcNAc:undecaprenyl-phosphate GlcNAc-1-phosphate transferase
MTDSLPFLVALGVSLLLTALLIRLAPRLGLVDLPDPRKVHTRPTPRAGGIAIFAAFALTVLLPFDAWPSSGLWLALAGLPVFVLGLIDDLRPLPWQLRLSVQFVAAAAAAWLLPPTTWPLRGLAVFWIVTLINAFNMLDNMDALSAGTAAIALGVLVLAGTDLRTGLALLGAILGFLWFNRPPARIFMGDGGSTFLGFVVGLGTAQLSLADEAKPWSLLAALAVCAVPCYDLTSVVLIRLREGRSPFHADRRHLSHRLVARGLPSPWAVSVIHVLALASGASGLLLYRAENGSIAALLAGQLALWWTALALIEYRGP